MIGEVTIPILIAVLNAPIHAPCPNSRPAIATTAVEAGIASALPIPRIKDTMINPKNPAVKGMTIRQRDTMTVPITIRPVFENISANIPNGRWRRPVASIDKEMITPASKAESPNQKVAMTGRKTINVPFA
jgi:hypothetical protein